MKWSSVDLAGGFIPVVTQKTHREAEIPISAACREALRRTFASRPPRSRFDQLRAGKTK
jgi:hypothetical protein